jgi:predicted N-acetyltransferase YhbS
MNNFLVREATTKDHSKIVHLLNDVFETWPRQDIDYTKKDYWLWKYTENPNTDSIVIVGVQGEEIVGCSHAIPVPVKIGDEIQVCYYGSDVAVHPEHRKKGLRNMMKEKKFSVATSRGGHYFFATSGNPILVKSYKRNDYLFPVKLVNMVYIEDIDLQLEKIPMKPSFLYKSGFHLLNSWRKIRNNLRIRTGESEKAEITSLEKFDERFDEFYTKISQDYGFIVKKDKDYLNWRYTGQGTGRFHSRAILDDNKVIGLCVSSINRFQEDYPVGYILELLTLKQEKGLANVLLEDAKKFLKEKNVNIVNYLVTDGSIYQSIANRNGFLNSRIPFHLFYTPFQTDKLRELERLPLNKFCFSWGDHDSLPIAPNT